MTQMELNDYLYACCLTKMQEVVSKASELMTVEECCDRIYSGGTPSTKNPEYWGGDLSWLSSGETHSRFIIDTEKKITEKGVEGSSTKLAYSGDIVMASAGRGFTRGQTSMLMLNTYVNQSVVVMHPKEGHSAYLLLELADSYDKLRAWSDSTSTRGSMSGKLLKQFEIPRVDQKTAFKLERFCESLFDLIESNLRECKALYELRDALLPKLMSGEIDISRIELPK